MELDAICLYAEALDVQREADDLTDDDIAATTILLFQAGHELPQVGFAFV